MKKEFLDILDINGNLKKVEVCFRFRNEENNKCYIVYKHNNTYFAAKYDDVKGISKLDTSLVQEELEVLEKFLNEMSEV